MSNFIITGFSDEIDSNIKIQFQELNKLGIEYYEPRFINDKNIADLDVKETEELLELMNEHGIKASSIGSPIGKISITDDFEPHFEKFKNVVRIAKALGTKYIRMFSFFVASEDCEKYRDEVIGRLSQLIEYAKKEDRIGRIQLIHKSSDAGGVSHFRRLDLTNLTVRDKVLQAMNNDELDHIFDTDGI